MPDISVLMSVYNGERWIKESIDSVLLQKGVDLEFIIINDGSTDNTSYILDSFDDDRLVIIHQENSGLTRALNRGLGIANGKFIARIDAGDICMPDRLFKQKKFLDDNLEVVLVGSNALLIDENGNEIGKAKYPVTHNGLVENLENFRSVFPHSSIFFRKEVIIREGGYNENFTRSQDYDLYLRLSEKYLLAGVDDYMVKLRYNPDSMSYCDKGFLQLKMGLSALICYFRRKEKIKDFSRSDEDVWLLFLDRIDRWLSLKKYKQKREAKIMLRQCRTLFRQGMFKESLFLFFSCFRKDPTFLLYRDINLKIPDDIQQFLKSDDIF